MSVALDDAPLLTKAELAEHYRVSVGSINNRMREGMPVVKVGRSVRFDLAEVEGWTRQRRAQSGQPNGKGDAHDVRVAQPAKGRKRRA